MKASFETWGPLVGIALPNVDELQVGEPGLSDPEPSDNEEEEVPSVQVNCMLKKANFVGKCARSVRLGS